MSGGIGAWRTIRREHGGDDGIGVEGVALPRRYRETRANPVSMGSAELVYGEDGRVRWDAVWDDFCDLALAGGPPHRPTLLEPGDATDRSSYLAVVAEICRALELVTGWATTTQVTDGWVGLRCPDAAAATWLRIAVNAENVAACATFSILLVPAGAGWRVEAEIKNVVTSVAKAHHYWSEHRAEVDAGLV